DAFDFGPEAFAISDDEAEIADLRNVDPRVIDLVDDAEAEREPEPRYAQRATYHVLGAAGPGGIPGLPGACSIIGYRKRKAGDGIIASPHAAEKYQQRKARDLNPRSTPRTALGLSEPARIDPHGCCPFSEEIRLG